MGRCFEVVVVVGELRSRIRKKSKSSLLEGSELIRKVSSIQFTTNSCPESSLRPTLLSSHKGNEVS